MKKLIGYLAKIFSWLVIQLPIPLQRLLGKCVGILWWDILRIRREVVFENIRRAFPDMPSPEINRLARKSLYHMGHGLVEYCYLPFLNSNNVMKKVKFVGQENLDLALKQGKGVCMLSLHMGSGDIGAAGLALYGYPIHILSKEFKIKWLNQMWFGLRSALGIQFIPPRNSSFSVLRAIKDKEIVVFVLDQFSGPPIGVKTHFFGHETGTGMGLTVMAKRTGAPVVLCYDHRNEDGTHTIYCEPEIPFEEKETKEKTLQHMTQVYTDHIEKIVKKHPEQWMWVHRRWKPFRV